MPSTAKCSTPPRVALVIATIFLTGCAGVGSDAPPWACPQVVAYSRAEQARVAEEVQTMQEGVLIPKWFRITGAWLRDTAPDTFRALMAKRFSNQIVPC